MRGLSLVAASGDHSSSRCAGLSPSRPLTITASLVAEHRLQTRRLSSCGSRAQLLRGMWDLPRPGLEPVSPALAGRFSTTAPPGKPVEDFKSQFQFQYLWLVCSYFLFLPGSVSAGCAFLRICPFLPGCPFFWHRVACINLS